METKYRNRRSRVKGARRRLTSDRHLLCKAFSIAIALVLAGTGFLFLLVFSRSPALRQRLGWRMYRTFSQLPSGLTWHYFVSPVPRISWVETK